MGPTLILGVRFVKAWDSGPPTLWPEFPHHLGPLHARSFRNLASADPLSILPAKGKPPDFASSFPVGSWALARLATFWDVSGFSSFRLGPRGTRTGRAPPRDPAGSAFPLRLLWPG